MKEHLKELLPLVDRALDLEPGERTLWLAKLREESPTIARELEELLATEGTLDRRGFLDTPPAIDSLVGGVAGPRMEVQLAQLQQALSDRYTVKRELGRGGMASVYLAADLRHARPVAIKVIRPDAASALGSERFLGEVQLTANLTHPNILPLLDSGQSNGVLYYVMPFIDGETLRAKMRREGALPVDVVIRTLKSVAEALAYAHEKGTIHRDIKPENILLSGRQVWVADFGIATALASSATSHQPATGVGGALGSPGYMAPEQIERAAGVDARADIYSLGVMVWEMLAGRALFTGNTIRELFQQHNAAAPTPLAEVRRDLSPELAAIVMKCLAKSRDARWPSAVALLEQVDVLDPSTGTRPASIEPRSRSARYAAGGVAGVAAIATIWWNFGRTTFDPTRARRLTTSGDAVFPALSPDGRWLAFRRSTPDVWIQHVDSSSPRRLAQALPGNGPTWLDDSTLAIIGPDRRVKTVRISDGRVDQPEWGSEGMFVASPGGSLFALSFVGPDSSLVITRRATTYGLRDSISFRRDPGERVLWLTSSDDSPSLAIGTRMPDSSYRISVAGPGAGRVVRRTFAVGDPAASSRLAVAPFLTRHGRFANFLLRRDTLLNVDLRKPDRPPQKLALDMPGMAGSFRAGRLAVTAGSSIKRVWRFSIPNRGAPTEIDHGTETLTWSGVSPDGEVLARFEHPPSSSESELVLVTLASASRRLVTRVTGIIDDPRWSPDGNRIAFRAKASGQSSQWKVADVRDGRIVTVGRPPVAWPGSSALPGFPPAWSPDGRYLFVTDFATPLIPLPRIRRHEIVDGDTGVVVSRHGEQFSDLVPQGIVVSPDGKALASGGSTMVLASLDGRSERVLVPDDSSSFILPLYWTENGEIVFSKIVRRRWKDLWAVSVRGGSVRRVALLDVPCLPTYSVFRGGTGASCLEVQNVLDIWLIDNIR